MYVHPAFKTDDVTALEFAAARGFGTLVAIDQGRPVATHLPFLLDRSGSSLRVEMHVARANSLHDVIKIAPAVLLTVAGPDAYISPDWYVSADQVPTWNYVSVHLSGQARLLDGGDAEAHVERLSDAFEARLAPKAPWKMSKMTAQRKAAMLKAIVGIEIEVDRVEASWKLGQHKSPADQAGVLRMLDWQGDYGALALAEVIKARR